MVHTGCAQQLKNPGSLAPRDYIVSICHLITQLCDFESKFRRIRFQPQS